MIARFSFFFLVLFLKCHAEHALSMHGDIKYQPHEPFAYVNPKAPKGGTLTLSSVGRFNTLNPYFFKGEAPEGLKVNSDRLVFESLMMRAYDEPFTLYGLIAERVEVDPDRLWIIFHINPKARFADGHPVTAEDVLFSYETLREDGKPAYQLHYKNVETATILSRLAIKFTFKKHQGLINRELPLIMGLMSVLPKHAFEGKTLQTADFMHVPGSGPYEIHSARMGQTITYKRRDNYWGKDLIKQQGFHNFDHVKIIYFFEDHLPLEALKAGHIDFLSESNLISWQRNYQFPRVKEGHVKKVSYDHTILMGMEGIALNARNPLFQDKRVRQALNLLFSFDKLNKNIYGGGYVPHTSYFDNSTLACQANYGDLEEKILKDLPSKTPYDLTSDLKAWRETQTLPLREKFRQAKNLLFDAGWIIHKGKLIHHKTRQPFIFELIISQGDRQKIALYFRDALKKMGITVTVRMLDGAQYEQRLFNHTFDSAIYFWGQSQSPGHEQKHYWTRHAFQTPGSRNYSGIQDKDVDACCDLISTAKSREKLVAAVHILDYLLLKGAYVVPLGYNKTVYAAYAHDLDHPPLHPSSGIHLNTWYRSRERKK